MFDRGFNRFFPLAIACLLSACAASMNNFDQYVDDYSMSMAAMDAATSTHSTSVTSTSDLPTVVTYEDDYYAEIELMMESMMGTTDDLEKCSMMESMDFSGMMTDMQTEMDSHHTAMTGASSMDEAQQEETDHMTTMDALYQSMDEMESQMTDMMGTDMGC